MRIFEVFNWMILASDLLRIQCELVQNCQMPKTVQKLTGTLQIPLDGELCKDHVVLRMLHEEIKY